MVADLLNEDSFTPLVPFPELLPIYERSLSSTVAGTKEMNDGYHIVAPSGWSGSRPVAAFVSEW